MNRPVDDIWEVIEHNPRPGILSESVEGYGMNRLIGRICWLKWVYGPVQFEKHHCRKLWWRFYLNTRAARRALEGE